MALNVNEEIIRLSQKINMIGEIKMFAGATIPNGWLLCDGSSFNATDHPRLAEVLGDSWGTHSGNTYYLPNLMGKVPVGYKTGDTDITETFGKVGATGGARGAWRHAHSWTKTGAGYGFAMMQNSYIKRGTSSNFQYMVENYTPFSIDANGSLSNQIDMDKANMPPYAVVKYIICAY